MRVISLNSFRGFSFIEVLFAWFILSTLILSILKIEAELLQLEKHIYFSNLASRQIENLFERFCANMDDPSREREFSIWDQQNIKLLPHGSGKYDCIGSLCRVSVYWQEKKEQHLTLETLL
jgi:type IV pilus assembly protein PilV